MKVLFINDYAPPRGGAEITMHLLCRELKERGHDARIFASTAEDDHRQPLSDYSCRGTVSRRRTLLQCYNPSAAISLKRALRDFKPDVVHLKIFLTQLSPLILPQLRDIPTLYHAVWYRAVCPIGTKLLPDGNECRVHWGEECLKQGCLPRRHWLPLMMQMRLLEKHRDCIDMIAANSNTTREYLQEAGYKVDAVINNGIEAAPLAQEWEKYPTVIYAGRLTPEKGVMMLLRSFTKAQSVVPHCQLFIIGDGPERATLESWVKQHNLSEQIRFYGFLPRAEVEKLCRKAWVQAAPSLWKEPFGNVVVEGMMRGTAVLASDSGGPAEILRPPEDGLLARTGDEDDWAQKMMMLLSNPSLCRQMGRAAHQRALREYSLQACADHVISLYHQLLSNR